MHALHFLSPVIAFLGQSVLFDIAIASAALLGVRWWVGYSFQIFNHPSGVAGFWHRIFSFTMCVVQHFGYFLLMSFQACLVWTPLVLVRFLRTCCLVGPRSALEGSPCNFPVFMPFLGRALKWSVCVLTGLQNQAIWSNYEMVVLQASVSDCWILRLWHLLLCNISCPPR